MNVIIIVIDTLRYDHVGANGNDQVRTPNLDRIIAKSWNFHRAFSASFPTIPHRTDALTGRYGAPFHPWKKQDCDKPTIPSVLAANGYCTQIIHDSPHLVNGGHNFDYPFDAWYPIRGAEVDRAWITDNWDFLDNWEFDPVFDTHPMTADQLFREYSQLSAYVQTNRHRRREEDWNVAQLFSTASRFLRDNARRENFMLWIDCFDPHEPWDSPPEFVRMYDDSPGFNGKIDPRSFHYPIRNSPDLSEAGFKRVQATYRAKVTFMDKWLGVFLDTLEETGLDRKSVLLITADHGTNVGDGAKSRFGKAAPPRENESHVPFIVYAPGIGSGDSDVIVQPQDIFATVLSLSGHADLLPEGLDSRNALDLAHGETTPREIALSGTAVGNWGRIGKDGVLFSASDGEWNLGFAANPERCELMRLGSAENVASKNPGVVVQLRSAAIDEIERRGLDPRLVEWLRNDGETDFPTEIRITDANPAPKGWRAGYWKNYYIRDH